RKPPQGPPGAAGGPPPAVDRGGVDPVDPQLDGAQNGGNRIAIVLGAPGHPAEHPAAKPDTAEGGFGVGGGCLRCVRGQEGTWTASCSGSTLLTRRGRPG